MAVNSNYPLEDFLEAITSQLDKTQDALRLKAVNRPLTFALKDFQLDLKVFVEMDAEGQVRFRPGGPNESGASTVTIGFTTITRPMIEENTVSMEMTRSPSLEEVGLAPRERKQLERLGVRNAAQLRQLEESTGDSTLSRLSGVNLDKLRNALQMGRPKLDGVSISPRRSPATRKPPPPDGYSGDISAHPIPPRRLQPRQERSGKRLNVPHGVRRVRLNGRNLIDKGLAPEIDLNGRRLNVVRAKDDEVEIEIPDEVLTGTLSISLGDELLECFEIVRETPSDNGSTPDDPWLPAGRKLP
jgi:hypothetical protein